MLFPLAKGPEPSFAFDAVQFALGAIALILIVLMAIMGVRTPGKSRDKASVGAGLAFTGAGLAGLSLLFDLTVGPTFALFASEYLGWGYRSTSVYSLPLFLVGEALIVAGLIIWAIQRFRAARGQRRVDAAVNSVIHPLGDRM